MRRETAVVLILLAAVLIPLWGLSIAAGNITSSIAVKPPSNSTLTPTAGFINTPTEFSVYWAGILSFLGVFAIVGVVGWQTKMIDRLGREGKPLSSENAPLPDVPEFIESEYRRVVAYWPMQADLKGVWLVGLFAFLAVVFAALFTSEAWNHSRLEFLGLYGALMFFSLAELVTMYATYFMPSIEVAENRDH